MLTSVVALECSTTSEVRETGIEVNKRFALGGRMQTAAKL